MPIACRHVLTVLAVLLMFGGMAPLASQTARSAEPPTLVVVFDGSGSMWGRIDGERQSKLVMAREALRQGLARLPPSINVGLMSFGHRRSGDCSDTEMIIEPAPLDLEAVMAPLEKLNPRGRGPITKALREAAGDLGPQSAPATVLLIHDGLDNCQQDPCSAIAELRAAHPRVTVHVASAGLSPDEAQTVACLPRATGGKHFIIASSDELTAAIAEATTLAAAELPAGAGRTATPPVTPPPDQRAGFRVPAGRPGLQLSARLVKDGPPVALPVEWTVRRAGEKGPPLWQGTTAAPLLVLPTGRYEIEARSGLVTRKETAEAVEGEPRAVEVILDAGTLSLAASAPEFAALADAVVTLARIEARGPAEPVILRKPASEIAVPTGNYLFSLTSGTLRIERPVGVEAGQRVSLGGTLGLGTVELSAVPAKGRAAVDGVVFVVYEDDPDAPQGRREVARSSARAPRVKLPAGTYFVIARWGAVETRERVIVRAGEEERRAMVLDAGVIALTTRLPGQLDQAGPITHRLQRLEPKGDEVLRASGPIARFVVGAGRYRLVTRVGLANVVAERVINLEAGETKEVPLELPAGAVRIRLLEPRSGRPTPDVSWEVRDATGQPVWSGLATEARALLAAGRYIVEAEARGQRVEHPIVVRPGASEQVDIPPG